MRNQIEEKENHSKTKRSRVTSIVGPQADAIKECLKRGVSIIYQDHSVEGLTILDIYTDENINEYWG